MKINWSVRLRNKQFWINLGASVVGIVFAYFGTNLGELTTWRSVLDLIIEAIKNPVVVFSIIACVFNAINDPTTCGLSDSKEALNYSKPK